MSSTDNRVQLEAIAQVRICDRLAPLVKLIDRLDSLYERSLDAIVKNSEQRASTKVALILTTRLADDLQVCSDLLLNFHPVAIGVSVIDTPFGAES